MIKLIPNDILIPDIANLIDEGMDVTLRAKGYSMSPYIRHEKDNLILTKPDREKLAKGDIVLGKTSQNIYVVHRIIDIKGNEITLMGDGNIYGTEICRRDDILGRVIYIDRDGRKIDCNTRYQRCKAAVLRTLHRVPRRIKYKIVIIIKKIIKR